MNTKANILILSGVLVSVFGSRTGSRGLKKKGPAPWETLTEEQLNYMKNKLGIAPKQDMTEEQINRIREQLGIAPKQGLKRKSPAPWETMTQKQLARIRKDLIGWTKK